MSREKQKMTVDEYRKKHKRCKTCVYANQKIGNWVCIAKGTCVEGDVGDYYFRGCFCKLYEARRLRQ